MKVSMSVLWVALNLTVTLSARAQENCRHGMAMMGDVKYKEGFEHFDYANPKAPKGGTIRIGATSTFDKLNPFTLKGIATGMEYDFIFETLGSDSSDEALSQYGHLAEKICFASDKLSVTYLLRKGAQFSDGKPVTAEDVAFSFRTLTGEGVRPNIKSYYQDVEKVVVLGKHKVKFIFKKKNPELHLILGQLYVLPKHVYGAKGKDFTTDFSNVAVGSGPYTVKKFEAGKIFVLQRNPNYWGKDLAIHRGKYNFDQIVVKVFRDQTIWLEAFKANEFDFARINSAKQWAVDVKGDKWNKNWISKKTVKHQNTAGMQGLVMNQRRPLFQDVHVRKALAIAFDFQWTNKTLFYGQYQPSYSYFGNSELQAVGLPAAKELQLLNPLKKQIPPEVFTQAPEPLGKNMSARQRLKAAKDILEKGGWKIDKKDRTMKKDGQPLKFEILLSSTTFSRIFEPYAQNLKKLGIHATIKTTDASIMAKRGKTFDYDMIVVSIGQSLSPGNEQKLFWHSSTVDKEGGQNYMGLKDKAIDTLVEAIIRAPTREDLVAATRALDRVLWFNYLVVPNWHINSHRITYWNKFDLPQKLPLYYEVQSYFLEYAWINEKREQQMAKAMEKDVKL